MVFCSSVVSPVLAAGALAGAFAGAAVREGAGVDLAGAGVAGDDFGGGACAIRMAGKTSKSARMRLGYHTISASPPATLGCEIHLGRSMSTRSEF